MNDQQPIQYLTNELFLENARRHRGGHWANAEKRWHYHQRAIEIVQGLSLRSAGEVLEIGTMGASLVIGSDTLDYGVAWPRGPQQATYFHDARVVPWPIEDKKYECLVALRVFQHLVPKQRECFAEAKRVARNVLILVPSQYKTDAMKAHETGPVTADQFREWNGGRTATLALPLQSWGTLYLWRERDFG
ncbi:MAG TPA: hypothetical protein VMF58_15660 [Rhizomicrobium sp.]|nr:hypothetical protein [Rhizomicrobium sp.]